MNSSLDLFVFADALGWTEVKKRGFMEDLFPFRQSCETLFGYSCTCDPSILTGCLPHEHGHFSFFVRAQRAKPFAWAKYIGWLPDSLAAHHRIRNRISGWVARKNGFTGYFQLYSVPFSKLPWLDYTEKRDIYEPGGILGGQPAIFERWRASGRPWMRSNWRRDDATNVASLLQAIDGGEVELAYLFTSGLDAVMHAHSVESAKTSAAFDRFEKWLRDIYSLARRRYRDVRLYLFSDHGMTDTQEVSHMLHDFEQLGLRYGRDYVAVWDSTMLRLWFTADRSARQEAISWLSGRKEGRILADQELISWGCYFEDRRYGELFYLLGNGTIFAPSYMNQRFVPAMHGFDPTEPNSAASWLTNLPVENPPKRIEQIYGVMRAAVDRLAIAS